MERLSRVTPADLESLLVQERGHRVSVYLPTSAIAVQASQDAIAFKNLLRTAQEELQCLGMKHRDARMMLSEATKLLDDSRFWRGGGHGVAVFISAGSTRVFRLPLAFEELVVVGDTFHIKPLLPLVSGNGRYSLLALSQSRLRLLQGDRWQASDATPPGMPTSLDEALQYAVFEKQSQVHTAGPARGAGASRASQFHGHGATERDEKKRILEFFRQVDSGVRDRLNKHRGPLVLAGVDYLRSLYREANTYPFVIDAGISGSPDGLNSVELHMRAWELLESHDAAMRSEAAGRVADRLGTGLVASDLREILSAAHFGRVDTLFVALDRHEWGRFDPGSGDIELADANGVGVEDLLDRATADTLLRRGRVFAVDEGEVPGHTPAAALLRY